MTSNSAAAAEPLFGNCDPRGGEYRNLGGAPCYGIFRCSDGHYVTLGALEEHFWARFCDLAGVPVNRTTALSWLPNGNIVFSNYAARAPHPKLVEITREKQVVWKYVDASKEGVHEFQLLDEAGKPLVGVLR